MDGTSLFPHLCLDVETRGPESPTQARSDLGEGESSRSESSKGHGSHGSHRDCVFPKM